MQTESNGKAGHIGTTIFILGNTVNVDTFTLYIFLRNSHFLNIRGNMYTVKNTFMIS